MAHVAHILAESRANDDYVNDYDSVCGGGEKGTITPLRERPTGGAVAMQHVLLLHKKNADVILLAVPAFPFEKQDNRWNFVHLCQSD